MGFPSRSIVQPTVVSGRNWRSSAFWLYMPRAGLSLLVLVMLFLATWVSTWQSDGLVWQLPQGLITSVDVGGPGDRAGVLAGDRVLLVDGVPLSGQALYGPRPSGEQVVLTVQRGAGTLDLPLSLAPPTASDLVWRLLPVIVAFSFWGTGVVLFVLRPRSTVGTSFFLLGQIVVLALAAGQLSAVNLVWAAYAFHIAMLALPPALANSYVALVEPRRRAVRAIPYVLAGASTILVLIELGSVLFGIYPGGLATRAIERSPGWGIALRLYAGTTLLVFTIFMVWAYFHTRSAHVRTRLRSLAFGTVVAILPFLLLSLLPDVLIGQGAGLPYQAGFAFLLLLPIFYTHVIIRYDLTPLDRFFNRSLVVFSLGLIWATLYMGSVGIGLLLFDDTRMLQVLLGALVTVGMAAVFVPLRERIQRLVDRLFYGGWYDYRSVIAQVSHGLGSATTRPELAQRLVRPVSEGLRLRGAALYLRSADGMLALEGCMGLDLPETLSADRVPLVPTATSSQHQSTRLSKDARTGCPEGVAWCLPLTQESKLNGLLLLGEKREDDFFEPADEEIVKTLGEQAGLAAANVLLMSDLKAALEALGVAQRQLLTAREEERRILAWELHDGPVQDLLALGYQLCECRDRARLRDEPLAGMLENVRQEVTRVMGVTRQACSTLRSDVLDVMGLGPAMLQYAYDLMQRTGIVVYMDVPRRGPKLADPLGITLLRIFQEALSNAAEHAKVSEVWASFSSDDGRYELRVWDMGQGFVIPEPLETLALQGHFGLVMMKERATAVNGQLEVQSIPGGGTRVCAQGPISPYLVPNGLIDNGREGEKPSNGATA